MSFWKLGICTKPMLRSLGNGRVLEYINFGNGITKSRILLGKQELLNRTTKVNKDTGERFISEMSRLLPDSPTRYFKHTKINNVYDEAGNLLKRNKLTEQGVADVASKGRYCRTSDVSLLTQKPNGAISEIKCCLPEFRYTRTLDTTPSIFVS